MGLWNKLRPQLDEMVNRWYETPEIKRLLSVPLTPARLQIRTVHMAYFSKNRRDCWAAVQSKAPLDVKRAIWEHEKEELIYDDRMGRAHVAEEDLCLDDESKLLPGARAAFYAWLHCSREKPWLEGLIASHILERRNNDRIVRGGTLTQRLVQKQLAEKGGTEAGLDANTKVHLVADIEHSGIFDAIFDRYVPDAATIPSLLRAAEDSLDIERAFHGAIATAMLEPEPLS
jgi:hypothetical protein